MLAKLSGHVTEFRSVNESKPKCSAILNLHSVRAVKYEKNIKNW